MKFSITPFDEEDKYGEITLPLNTGVTMVIKGQRIKIDIIEIKE